MQPVTASRLASFFVAREKRNAILCLLLVLFTLVSYNPVVHNGFTDLDDYLYIENDHVLHGLHWNTVKWAFSSFEQANWHPITWLSHALDVQIFGLNPAGHHYETVLLHATNAALLFLLLQGTTGLAWPSLMVAGLFAVHPVNVESVAWASERKNVLSMFFFLLALHAYGWYAHKVCVKRYAAVAALFAVGLMAKPEIITLPFVLLLWDYWPLRRMAPSEKDAPSGSNPRPFTFLVLEKIPLLLLSAASGMVAILAQRAGGAMHTASTWERFWNVPVSYMSYLGKAVWPVRLAAFYPLEGRSLPVWQIVASSAAVFLITLAVLRLKNRRYLATGWFWFLGTLVPVLGLVQVGLQSMADRYVYLPYIGLFVAVVWGVAELAQKRRISGVWLGALSALVVLTLGFATRQQVGYWHDSETLWRHTLAVTGDRNFAAHDGLARDLALRGRADEAVAEFEKAESVYDYTPSAMMDIGVYEQTHGHPQEAVLEYSRAADLFTDSKSHAEALTGLGSAFIQLGDFARAKSAYSSALREDANNTRALMASGLIAERDGNLDSAVSEMSHALKIEPSDVGYLLLGQALRRAGRLQEADGADEYARQISRELPAARAAVAKVSASFGMENSSGAK
jgi:protein O-mannosyl-transferase